MNSDLKAQLGELNIRMIKEIEVGGRSKVSIIFVPVPQELKSFQKIEVQLVQELEKKFSGSMLSRSLRGELCLSQLGKAVQKRSKSAPGAPL